MVIRKLFFVIDEQVIFYIPGSFLATSVAFLFVFSLVYARSLLLDIRDIQGDQLVGRETVPIIIGMKKTKLYIGIVLIITAVCLSISGWLNWASSLSFFLLASIGYCAFYLYLYHKRIISQGVSCDAVVDGQFYLTGLITLFWMNSFAA